MSAVLLWWSVALDAGVLAGLVARGRWRAAYMLPVVLLATLASATTVGVCPHCNTWQFWLAKEFVHIALLLLLGVELSLRLSPRGTPARRRALTWLGAVTASLVLLVALAPRAPLMVYVLPLLIGTVIFLYAGLPLVLGRYGLKLGPLHDAVLYGFPFYLVVYVALWGYSITNTTWANLLSPLAFDLMMTNLLRVAWQREEHVVSLREFVTQVGERLSQWRRRLARAPKR